MRNIRDLIGNDEKVWLYLDSTEHGRNSPLRRKLRDSDSVICPGISGISVMWCLFAKTGIWDTYQFSYGVCPFLSTIPTL